MSLTAAWLYLAVCAFMFLYQRHLMYFPDTVRPDAPAVEEIVKLRTVDGLDLQGWYFAPRNQGKPVIAVFHGNAYHALGRMPKLQRYRDAGYGLLLAEYRGYGGNPGSPTEEGLYKDARAFLQWLRMEKGVEPSKTVLYGESLGTGVAVQMAAEAAENEPYSALILEAPFSATVDLARKTYFYLPVDLLMKDQFRSREKIGKIRMPLLVLHGDRDEVVPLQSGQALFEAAHNPKTFIVIDGGTHHNLYSYGAASYVTDFLSGLEKKTSKKH
ncbi:MAG: alpha/beta hydrolase [Alphaproteobacteria bacterium]